MTMRKSRVLKRLREGDIVSCIKINLDSSRAVEQAGMLGFDCMWAEMEHAGTDWNLIERQILAGKVYDMDAMVRVTKGSYSDYIRPLELDATGIMVPHIMSVEEARSVVRMTRFHPVGRRPVDGGNTDGAFTLIPPTEYMAQANRERFVILQIEDPEPLDDLDAIAAVEGYDVLFFGPGDFSHSMGIPGQYSHPEVLKARRKVVEVAVKHGKFAGTPGSPASLPELTEMGFRFIPMGADVLALNTYFKSLNEEFDKHRAARGKLP